MDGCIVFVKRMFFYFKKVYKLFFDFVEFKVVLLRVWWLVSDLFWWCYYERWSNFGKDKGEFFVSVEVFEDNEDEIDVCRRSLYRCVKIFDDSESESE